MRIIAIEQHGAGPFGSLHLSDLGAEVIKIENPHEGGDIGRYIPPFNQGEDSLFFETFNHGKRSISLDLGNEAGRQIFDRLVAKSDAVFTNLRGGVVEKLRLRYRDLSHLNRKIVCCCLTGFGNTGPRQHEAAYDPLIQAMCGWMSLTGEPEGEPTKSGLSLVDYCGGLVSVIALLSAVHAARRDGQGMDCDQSLFDTAMSLLTYTATWNLTGGWPILRTRRSAHPSLVPFQLFQTADGWIVMGCAKDSYWTKLVKEVDREELLADSRFRNVSGRFENRDELLEILEAEFLTCSCSEWEERLNAAGVPCSLVRSVEDALLDPQVTARELIIGYEHPTFGSVRMPRTALDVGNWRATPAPAPARNADLPHIMHSVLGYSDAELSQLRSAGAFG